MLARLHSQTDIILSMACKNLFSESTEAASNYVAPARALSSTSETLDRGAPSTSCSSSALVTVKKGSQSAHHDLFSKALKHSALSAFLKEEELFKNRVDYLLTSVKEAAWSFISSAIIAAQKSPRGIWVICSDMKSQEHFFQEIHSWLPETVFFPDLEIIGEGLGLPDPEVLSERLAVLGRLARGERLITLIAGRTLTHEVPSLEEIKKGLSTIHLGEETSPMNIVERLYEMGFARTTQVGSRGELALRGGILDLFPWQSNLPYRLEFDETKIVSLRTFDPHSQRSIQEHQYCELQSADLERGNIPFAELIAEEDLLFILGDDCKDDVKQVLETLPVRKIQLLEGMGSSQGNHELRVSIDLPCYPIPFASFEVGDFVMQESKRKEFFSQLHAWHEANNEIIFFSSSEGEQERFSQFMRQESLDPSSLSLRLGELREGFSFEEAGLIFLADGEIFGRSARARSQRFRAREDQAHSVRSAMDFREFVEGDFVVHTGYGVGRYQGIEMLPSSDGTSQEVLALEFDEEARLFVPLEEAWKVSRYVGVGKAVPHLSSLNNEQWHKSRAAAEKSIFLYAGKLLKLQAERELYVGHAFGPDTPWQRELEKSFPYSETQDQLHAIAEIKEDMESPQPMDRLLCGDVGFGKTEVALRAAFKALMDSKQVVFLAPTTVLAQQHYENLRERMSSYPLSIELMSRYRTAAEQRRVVQGLASGSIDLVVGTHRLFSPDIIFKNLGLVIVDEEQRFGVKHKEAFKDRFRLVDMLTLSATPIPRTLYLSLMGARKMSLLETPPANRQPVETIVAAYDERLIRDAAERELARGGQVYFLHNRIETIEKVAFRLQELLPQARIAWGHGQMDENALEEIMQRFVSGEINILVSTTIIESGLDIPNANTIFIDRADRFGLADLYQLRGRVGRSEQKAYAYLLLPRSMMLEGEARRRVQAIRQYSALGAGFKIAMRDLEIRGAGNLLGTAQSGHITSIGFDFYCKMLHQAVGKLKGEISGVPSLEVTEVMLEFDFLALSPSAWAMACDAHKKREKEARKKFLKDKLPAFLPEEYLPEAAMRIEGYRDLAEACDKAALDELEKSWRDRFGPLPLPVKNLLDLEWIRRVAAEHGVTKVETRGPKLIMTRKGDYILLGHQFPRLMSLQPEAKLKEILGFLQGAH